ncbi:MAG: hypothetical protein IJR82_05170 [Bacilli bacterium]|nr:hypothetical protein [Bacilli bacterium]
MKTIDYFQNKMNGIDRFNNYSKEQKDYVANYFYLLFMQLSKMSVIKNNCIRELCELEQFLFMYINILNLIKDKDDNNTSHNIIGSIITGKAVCEGYNKIMQFICQELSLPFLYQNTISSLGPHGNFQVIVKDKQGLEHCLHCDSYIDAKEHDNDTITFNATLIPAEDMNNYYNFQEPSSEFLFWNFVLYNRSLEQEREKIEQLTFIEEIQGEQLEQAIDSHYRLLREQIGSLNQFFRCNIDSLETHNDLLEAYQLMNNYYHSINTPISREELYSIIKQLYISYNIIIKQMDNRQAIYTASYDIDIQIQNSIKKHSSKWIK